MSDLGEFYGRLNRLVMPEAELFHYGYPRPGNAPGRARVGTHHGTYWKVMPGPRKRICERCSKVYEVDSEGWPAVRETCKWHMQRARNGVHPCCGHRQGGQSCQTSDYHIHCNIDPANLTGFINTSSGAAHDRSVLALDCEMVATTRGYEVVALTVVDHRCRPVYETMVKPEGHVLNYNTPFSGLTAADLRGVTTTLRDVHAKLLTLMGPRTILVGHGMHNDLMSLRLLHGHIVDTIHLYPHVNRWPSKSPLSFLKKRHLPRLNEGGLKCREDAVATMMLARIKSGIRARP
ncbi:putative exonuclease GOR isoform X6 [Eriocheir sinensis]|uniref:putative exonuclease GOR isoform X2 n=1 Tax=Eriocheir sinensis TaxID=95602 RepID=UPI0021C86556|nr:putative exonuclease GOR isoform X2 [Eriocheir sinensis]XP_050724865.1 putative exonuclease GOR isoform X3 [Eriocheir sinensis]XP_050724868.1 putative exonuclease GOR isoform X6 [Eriocheir sinensis]